jgi:AcrR family transcriptional regulator
VRGQRTQQRILDAALKAFGEVGYHQCSIDSITKRAGCSRVSFYQYFSSKEDVFRRLAVHVARQLNASTDLLDPITADAQGWAVVRGWVDRYAEIHDRYQPVFNVFPAAVESDAMLEDDSTRTAHRYLAGIQSRVVAPTLPSRDLDAVIGLLRECLGRTLDDLSTLTTAAPRAFPLAEMLDAYTDVVHRTLFGVLRNVNVHDARGRRPPKLPFGPIMRAAMNEELTSHATELEGRRALAKLLPAARDVFVERGYHGTRVDDIVEAAGVSHGAFYRYFRNKDELAHLLAAQAMRTVSETFAAIPDVGGDGRQAATALRRWLRAYNRVKARETAMTRVWADAALQDDSLAEDSAAILDWGRRRMVRFLEPRRFGDPELDAIVLLALVDTFGGHERPTRTVDAAVHIIERGFLGH